MKNKKKCIGNSFILLVILVGTTWFEAANYNNNAIYTMQNKYSENIVDIVEKIEGSENKKIVYVVDDINQGMLTADLYDRNIKYLQFYLYDSKIECINLSEIDFIQEEQCYVVRKESKAFSQMMENTNIYKKMKYCNDLYAIFYTDMD